jgi:uncharacterized protein YjbI with pentapeptide repeats
MVIGPWAGQVRTQAELSGAKEASMADEEQLRILKQGAEAWNAWREEHGGQPDLRAADLHKADLRGADLIAADLREANLGGADLVGADIRKADLRKANLEGTDLRATDIRGADLGGANLVRAVLGGAKLCETDLSGAVLQWAELTQADLSVANLTAADLRGATLSAADLHRTNLGGADLRKASLTWAKLNETELSDADMGQAQLGRTIFANLTLKSCKGLEACDHHGPSSIDIQTLQRSGQLPLTFLRGVGLPDTLIEYLPSLLGQAIQHYSCFISYSSNDDEFVHRLHADLQDKGVRCWFAPHDMKIGAKILDTLDQAIRLRDKVLLVLSEASIASEWVEDEVTKAFAEERQRGGTVLFPVRLDDIVFATKEAWALKLRDNRNIGDFRAWKDHDAYQKALKRVLRDLQIEPAPDTATERA